MDNATKYGGEVVLDYRHFAAEHQKSEIRRVEAESKQRDEQLRIERSELKADMNARFDAVDARFDRVDARLDRMDARFDKMDARLDKMDAQIVEIRKEISDMRSDLTKEMRSIGRWVVGMVLSILLIVIGAIVAIAANHVFGL